MKGLNDLRSKLAKKGFDALIPVLVPVIVESLNDYLQANLQRKNNNKAL